MPFRTLAATTAALAMSAGLAPTTHASDDPSRIIGGTVATENPGAVSLYVNDSGSVRYNCSASLVDADTVLTARHCVDGDPVAHLRVGSLQHASGGTTHKPAEIAEHPSADLAVITLATPVANPKTVSLAAARPATGTTGSIYGWGKTVCDSGDASPVLKTANVRVSGVATDGYGGTAIASTGINGTAWRGDSGGPQFNSAGEQVGVLSTGNCYVKVQNYTSVADYRTWITSQAAG